MTKSTQELIWRVALVQWSQYHSLRVSSMNSNFEGSVHSWSLLGNWWWGPLSSHFYSSLLYMQYSDINNQNGELNFYWPFALSPRWCPRLPVLLEQCPPLPGTCTQKGEPIGEPRFSRAALHCSLSFGSLGSPLAAGASLSRCHSIVLGVGNKRHHSFEWQYNVVLGVITHGLMSQPGTIGP